MDDRRSYRRWDADGMVEVETAGDGPRVLTGELVDVSFAGAGLRLDEPLAIGDAIALRVETADGQIDRGAVLGRGRVVHVSPAQGMGPRHHIHVRLDQVDEMLMESLVLRLQRQSRTHTGMPSGIP